MPTLADLRSRLPALRDYDDAQALQFIQAAYYPGRSVEELGSALGVKPPEPPAPPRSLPRGIADLGVEVASGVARGVKFTSEALGADNAVARGAGAVDEYARSLLSAKAQHDDARVSEIMAAAQDGGVWDQVKAAAEAFSVAPFRMAANALGTSVPTVAAAMVPGGNSLVATRLAALAGMGAAQGAGVVKGAIFERVKAEHIAAGASEEEAAAAAMEAQSYGGENTANIASGAALTAAGMATGVQPVAARLLSGSTRAAAATERGLIGRAGLGIAKEAPLEAMQGGHEQYAGNVALQREGFDVPAFQGVAGQAALEGLASAGPGAAFGALDRARPAAEPAPADNQLVSSRRVAGSGALVSPAHDAQRQEAETRLAGAGTVDEMVKAASDIALAPLSAPPIVATPVVDENAAMARLERMRADDQAGLRQWVEPGHAEGVDGPLGIVPPMESPLVAERAGRRRTEAQDLSSLGPSDPVLAYVERVRQTNTPAARAFVQDFNAGRITRRDIIQVMQSQPADPLADFSTGGAPADTASQRLQRAREEGRKRQAAQAPQPAPAPAPAEPQGLQVARTYRTRSAAAIEARRTGGEVTQVGDGFAVENARVDDGLEAAAHEAATSQSNDLPEPTDAQKEAGNYRVGHVRVSGLDVSIENPKGSTRKGKADAAKPWKVTMPAHYGYIKGTKGADGDHVDLFIGDRGDNGRFWIIDQTTPDGSKFDEHKVVTGVDSAEDAVRIYKASFADNFGEKVYAGISAEMDADALKAKLPELSRPAPAAEALTPPAVAANDRRLDADGAIARTDRRTLQEKVERPAADGAVVATDGDANAEGDRKFYVTMVRGDRVARLAGPFDTKEEADGMVARARDEANKADPRSAFDAFGVSGITSKEHKPGTLNATLGIAAPADAIARAPTMTSEQYEAAVAERTSDFAIGLAGDEMPVSFQQRKMAEDRIPARLKARFNILSTGKGASRRYWVVPTYAEYLRRRGDATTTPQPAEPATPTPEPQAATADTEQPAQDQDGGAPPGGPGDTRATPAPAAEPANTYPDLEGKTIEQSMEVDGHQVVRRRDAAKAMQLLDERDHFSVQRLNRETDTMEPVVFERGEYVRVHLIGSNNKFAHGEIDGISHARREFSVDGLWHTFGAAYKAERPAAPERKDAVPLSSVVDAVNKKHGEGLGPADAVSPFEAVRAVVAAMWDGKASLEDYRAGYRRLQDEAGVKADLDKLTKDELNRMFRFVRDGKKAELVDMAYRDLQRQFALEKQYGPSSYMMTRDGLANYEKTKAEALDALVDGHTAEDLAEFAEGVRKNREEIATRRANAAKAIENPQTLDDYVAVLRASMAQGKTLREAYMGLEPEQRERFDDLNAEAQRARRKDSDDAQRTAVRVAGQTVDGEISATKHTKKGHDLFVVKLSERVSREDYNTLNAGAKKIGGYYSSFRGGGAIPGFQFTTREQAEAFVKLAGGDSAAAQEAVKERRDAFADDRSQTAVERLREMADRLAERADESLGRDRQVNTDRRARMAASAEASANADKALAATMRNLADAIETGKVRFLDRVRQKAQVEFLQNTLRAARDEELRQKYPRYVDYERHKDSPPTKDTASYADAPSYTAFRSDLAALGRRLLEEPGFKTLGQRVLKVADDVSDAYTAWAKENLFKVSGFSAKGGGRAVFPSKTSAEASIVRSGYRGKAIPFSAKRGEWLVILSPSEAVTRGLWQGDGDKRITLDEALGTEIVEKAAKAQRRGTRMDVPWQFETAHEKIKRLVALGLPGGSMLRAGLREFVALREAPAAPNKVKELERAMVGRAKDGLDFFPTPEAVADEMVEAAGIEPGMRVLEPSAGWGHIAERIRSAGVEPDVIELSNGRRELLEAKGFNVVGRDFMEAKAEDGGYDRILMNPPFSDGRDIEHIRHAYSLLKPGGRVVAIMGEGAFVQSMKRAQAFRDWVEEMGGTVEKLPEGTFNDPSLPVNTGANARMVVIDKPEGDLPAFQRTLGDQSPALKALSEQDELFALPKSAGKTVSEIAFDIDPTIKVTKQDAGGSYGAIERWRVTMPGDGGHADITIRKPNPYGPTVYGFNLRDGEMVDVVTERPGENREAVPDDTEDIYIDASKMKEGGGGYKVYAIAGALAHNTGRIFIGDPNGVSPVAMRRRAEQMLSLALKYGTTDFLAPHPDQIHGEASIGVPPLKWVYGDDEGNAERLIALNVKAVENAFPAVKKIDFDVNTGHFLNTESGRRISREGLKRRADQLRDEADPALGAAAAGGTTLARAAWLRAVLREARGTGEAGGGRDGVLDQLVAVAGRSRHAAAGIFRRADEGVPGRQSVARVQSLADQIASAWENAPPIKVVQDLQDPSVDAAVRDEDARQRAKGATGSPSAFFHSGTVYIVAGEMASDLDVAKALFHEALGHAGLRAAFGDSLNSVLDRMAALYRPAVEAKGVAYGLGKMTDAGMQWGDPDKGLSPQAARRRAAEEVLAELAETRPESTWVQKAIAAIRTWLRENLSGVFGDMKLSDAEIIRSFIVPARNAIERGDAKAVGGMPLFQRQADQTDTPEFLKWFGDSKVVDAEGKPLVVYHGTFADFSKFSDRRLGENTDDNASSEPYAQTSRVGFWFNTAPMGGSSAGYTVDMPVYLSIQNPKREMSLDWLAQGLESTKGRTYRRQLIAEGYDGLVLADEEFGGESWVAFRPEQIKSATGNRGTFDGTNPDIRFQRTAALGALREIGGGKKVVGQTKRQYSSRVLEAMSNVGFQVETPTLEARAKAMWANAGKKLAQGLFDQFAPIKNIDEKAYALMRLSKGAAGAFEVLLNGGKLKLNDGVYDFDETGRGGVLESLFIPLQGEHHDFLRWVAANRAERLIGEGKENLFTQADIDALKTLTDGTTDFDYTIQNGAQAGKLTRDRTLIYRDALVTFNEFSSNVMDMAEKSGLIDGEARGLWEQEFYVPFYRVEETGEIAGANIKSGVVRQEAFRTLTGRGNKLNADLLDNTLMNWAHLLDAAAKNRAAKASIEAAESMGAAQKVEGPSGKGTVWFREGGERRYSFVSDDAVLDAVSSLAYTGMRGPMMTALGAMKHALTVGVTASPFFKVRNLIRDSVQAIGASPLSYNVAANVAKGWKLTDPKADDYFRLLAGGGTIHFGTMMEGNEAKRVQALVESGMSPATMLNGEHKLKAFYRKVIEPAVTAYNELGNRGEAVNRASLYDQLRKQGIGHAEASLQARDLMDFSMQGTFASVRFLAQTVPFFNARLQGLYKLGRAAKDDPRKLGAVIGAAAVASVALAAAYGDDDDWKKREEWDRNNFWWFKFGGTAYRIPKPFEVGAIATLAERGFELFASDEMTGERFRGQVLKLLGDNLSMNPIPQLVKPMLDVYANKNSFTGRPIETMGMERLQPEYRFTDRTTMTARALSTAANAVTGAVGGQGPSPVQIDHMIRGYFGWLGTFVVTAPDMILRPLTDQREAPAQDQLRKWTDGMVSDLRDAPSRYVSQMYEQSRELEQAYGTWRQLVKEGRGQEAAEVRADNAEKLAKFKRVERTKEQVSSLNTRIRIIERSNLPADVKRERIRDIQDRKDQIARAL